MISIHPYNIIQSIFSALKILYAISIYPYPAPQPLSTTNLFTVSIVLSFPECNIVVQLLSHLCNPMDCSMPSFPVHHQLPEPAQTVVHRVGDAIQPSHPLSSPFPALNLSQHQGLFKWVSSSHQVAKSIGVSGSTSVLPMNTQDWSPLGWTGWISLPSKGLSRVFSNTTVQKHQFFSTQISFCPTLTSVHDHWKNHSLD